MREQKKNRNSRRGSSLWASIQALDKELEKTQAAWEVEKEKEAEREKLSAAIDRLTRMLPGYDASERLERELKKLGERQTEADAALEELRKQKDSLLERKDKLNRELEQLADIEVKVTACEQDIKQLETTQRNLNDLQVSLARLGTLESENRKLQQQFEDAQSDYQAINSLYTEREAAFFREQAGLLAATARTGSPAPYAAPPSTPARRRARRMHPAKRSWELKRKTDLTGRKCNKRASALPQSWRKSILRVSSCSVRPRHSSPISTRVFPGNVFRA